MTAPAKITGASVARVLLAKAEANDIDVTSMSDRDLYMAVRRLPDPRSLEERRAEGEHWAQENPEAMEASNRWMEEHGLPLGRYRRC